MEQEKGGSESIAEIIKRILGPELESRGYRYEKNHPLTWEYKREIYVLEGEDREKVEQSVVVQKSKYRDLFYLNIFPRGHSMFRPELYYDDKSDYEKIMIAFRDSLIEEGFDIIESSSIPKIPKTQRISSRHERRLYEEHDILLSDFIKEKGIHMPVSDEEAVRIIVETVGEARHRKFSQSEDIILKLAAFYGALFESIEDNRYVFKELSPEMGVCELGLTKTRPLLGVFRCWYEEDSEISFSMLYGGITDCREEEKGSMICG